MIKIGRDPRNDIVIEEPGISRFHLELKTDAFGNTVIRDLDSKNGTYVNGRRIQGDTTLMPGDTLTAATTEVPWEKYAEVERERLRSEQQRREAEAEAARKSLRKTDWGKVLMYSSSALMLLAMLFFLINSVLSK